jgi:hypothetical protein
MNSGATPPIGPDSNAASHPDDATWPGWVGGVSIAFGALTALGVCCGTAGTFAGPMMASKMAGIEMPPAPGAVIGYMLVDALLGIVLAALLVMGGLNTLRRRASGPRTLRKYAILRLALTLPILIGGLWLLRPQAEWAAGMVRATNEWKESQNPPMPVTDAEREQETVQAPGAFQYASIGIGVVIGIAWPLVVLAVLRRPDSMKTIEHWDA